MSAKLLWREGFVSAVTERDALREDLTSGEERYHSVRSDCHHEQCEEPYISLRMTIVSNETFICGDLVPRSEKILCYAQRERRGVILSVTKNLVSYDNCFT